MIGVGALWRATTLAGFLTVPAEGSSLSRYLEEIRRFPMLEPEEEFVLAKSWQEHGDVEAAHRLVTSHLRLVAKIAMGYRGYGLPLNEIISEGNVGLMQAVKRFDPDRGFRLATYAMWWIRAAIQEYILHSWSLVKMGTTAAQKKLFFNLRKLKGQMQAIDEGDLRPETVKAIAERLDVTENDVVEMNRRLEGADHSLNVPLRSDSETQWQDWLVDDAASQESTIADADEFDHRHVAAAPGDGRAQRARAAHPERAPAQGRADHPRGAERAVRHLARAGAPDRGARVREAAARDQGAGGRAGGDRPAAGAAREPARSEHATRPPHRLRRFDAAGSGRIAPGRARHRACSPRAPRWRRRGKPTRTDAIEGRPSTG